MPGPQAQILWTHDLKHSRHLFSQSSTPIRIHFPPNQFGPKLVGRKKLFFFKNYFYIPFILFSRFFVCFFFSFTPSQGTIIYLSRLLRFGKVQWSYWLSAERSLLLHIYFQFALPPTKFIHHSASQLVTTKLSSMHYLSTRVHQWRRHSPYKKELIGDKQHACILPEASQNSLLPSADYPVSYFTQPAKAIRLGCLNSTC